jgi:hypothetical protein
VTRTAKSVFGATMVIGTLALATSPALAVSGWGVITGPGTVSFR